MKTKGEKLYKYSQGEDKSTTPVEFYMENLFASTSCSGHRYQDALQHDKYKSCGSPFS